MDRFDAVVAVTGAEGMSKSLWSLRFALAVDEAQRDMRAEGWLPDVTPWTLDNLCYTARDVLGVYRRAKRAEVVWYDEGARGLLAGETFDPEQVALVRLLMLGREKGAILVVCIPDIRDLAKKVRGRRATFWVHVTGRGTIRRAAPSVARLHERDDRINYLPTQALGLARSTRCPSIEYEPFADDYPPWAAYLTTKNRRLDEFIDEEDAKLAANEARALRARERVLGQA